MPTAVVIIAARDAAHWLQACVDSVLAQRIPSGWDIGVAVGIDACAPTLALASHFSRSRLTMRFFPEHVGPYIIFNSLACATRSDVLVRFDADDIMLQGYLSEQLCLVESNLAPTIIQTWSIYVDAHLQPCSAPLSNGTRTPSDGRRAGPSDGQFLMTRSVLERLGSFRGWPCHADSEFMRRAQWSGIPRRIVTKHLYLRRVHPHSLTASKRTRYDSGLRRSFGHQIEEAGRRYARGDPPEWVYPVVARYVPVGGD
jgi:glycosyltransferase involved in cell wall biosynthesis